jgi:hypothetical protein
LIQKAISHLRSAPNAAVLFEDPVSLSSDAGLARRNPPPLWEFGSRIFWPVLSTQADPGSVERARDWVAGFREIVCFVEVPRGLALRLESRVLSQEEFGFIASSLRSLVTDVFDGEGYMEWLRGPAR